MKIIHVQSTASTSDDVAALLSSGHRDVLVYADEQTNGRGTNGRKWYTGAGNLYMSFSLEFAGHDPKPLSYAICYALFSTISGLAPSGLQTRIKPPNDILISGKKVSGILIEKYDSFGVPAGEVADSAMGKHVSGVCDWNCPICMTSLNKEQRPTRDLDQPPHDPDPNQFRCAMCPANRDLTDVLSRSAINEAGSGYNLSPTLRTALLGNVLYSFTYDCPSGANELPCPKCSVVQENSLTPIGGDLARSDSALHPGSAESRKNNDLSACLCRKCSESAARMDLSKSQYIVGIGVNLVAAPLPTATSVLKEFGQAPDRMSFIKLFLDSIVTTLASPASHTARAYYKHTG